MADTICTECNGQCELPCIVCEENEHNDPTAVIKWQGCSLCHGRKTIPCTKCDGLGRIVDAVTETSEGW